MAKHDHPVLQVIDLVQNRIDEITEEGKQDRSVTVQGKLTFFLKLRTNLQKFMSGRW